MTQTTSNTPQAGNAIARARYQAALASAIVAGVFSLVVCGFLAAAHVRTLTLDLQKSEDLASLRAALLKTSDAAAVARLKEEIRRRDLALRQEFFSRQAFSRSGGYLLAGGVVVFLIAASQVAACRKRLPMPHLESDAAKKAARSARLARTAVIVLGAALAGGGVLLGILVASGPKEPASATGQPGAAAGPAADFPSPQEIARQWPRFRGPGGLGVSAYTNVPDSWNGKTGANILWKTPVPLPGVNSPVVWGDRIFLTGAVENKREVYCFDAATGKVVWQKAVETPAGAAAEPPEVLEDTGFAAPTAATDGRYVAAIFANGDVACFDTAGKMLWARNLGPIKNTYGYASSLDMYHNTVLVLLDQGSPAKPESSLLALDLATGKTAWETRRPVPASWATPILVNTGKREEFITAAKPWVISYAPGTGTELWRAKVLDGDVAPSPTFGGGMVFAVNAGAKLSALRLDGQGDITDTHVAWGAEDGLPDIVSPLTDGRLVWLMTTDGLLTAYRVKDGTKAYEKELDVVYMASPTLVGDRLYLFDEKGAARIIGAGEAYKELEHRAELGEPVHASPAFLDGRIYVRGTKHLYAIGKK